MTEKLYYWAENLDNYKSHNELDVEKIIEIKKLNFFIGKNNAGKSRLLRSLFLSQHNPKDFLVYNLNIKTCKKLYDLFNNAKYINSSYFSFYDDHSFSADEDSELRLLNLNDSTRQEDILKKFSQIKKILTPFNRITDPELDEICRYSSVADFYRGSRGCTDIYAEYSKIDNHFKNNVIFKIKYYLPILRGMRPVTNQESEQPYLERTKKDYFSDNNQLDSRNIITGERIYHELKIHLLGEPEQREIIKSYEEKLSQYFFDNETVTLIPKHNQDVVNIKIGNDRQFPISELGDGLQQVIILTYEAFIKNYDENGNEQTHAFFIEEPELHMHAGMVRQLMNFYLNETKHYYFFTTHSNHLLDMADESDQVIIQKFVKEQNKDDATKFNFKIYRCDRDRDLLASLGVKPSSVYLANCTIWVEGITDRLYITKYMEKYLKELKTLNPDLYKQYLRFMPNYHYTFIEYAGSNLVHWSFSDEYADHLDDKGLSAKAIASEMLLIADGDIQTKPERVKALEKELNKENYFILKCKETENTLPKNTIIRVAEFKFAKMHRTTTQSYNISLLTNITDDTYFDHDEFGIGKLLDQAIKKPKSTTTKTAFADGQGVGTIKHKLDFCREIIKDFDGNSDWKLTPKATELCERIFQHIEKCNKQ